MKKICCVLIFLILVPAFSYAEIDKNLDTFKEGNFFIKYKFSVDAKPYTVNVRTFIDFYQKETLDKVMIELDSKSNRIIKQIGYLKDKGTVGELIVDFITEATGGKAENKTITDLLNEFNAGFKKEGKLELGGVPSGTTKEKRIGEYYVTIEKTILDEYIVTVEGVKEVEKREGEYKEFVQKLEKGDCESYILKGRMAEQERWTDPSTEAMLRALGNAIPSYQKAIELSPENQEANTLLANAYIETGKYEEAVTSLKKYLSLNTQDGTTYCYLGKAYRQLKDNEQAAKNLKIGLDLIQEKEKSYELYHELALALKEIPKYEEAIEVYNNAIDHLEKLTSEGGFITNEEPIFHLELGELYLKKGDKTQALGQLEKLRSVQWWKLWADKLEALIKKGK